MSPMLRSVCANSRFARSIRTRRISAAIDRSKCLRKWLRSVRVSVTTARATSSGPIGRWQFAAMNASACGDQLVVDGEEIG